MAAKNSAKSSTPLTSVSASDDRERALETALSQIERQFGKGSVMRLGDEGRAPIEVIPTGSIALDVALGIGGLPRGRIIEVYGPGPPERPPLPCMRSPASTLVGRSLHRRRARVGPGLRASAGCDLDNLYVSQPDTVSRHSKSRTPWSGRAPSI